VSAGNDRSEKIKIPADPQTVRQEAWNSAVGQGEAVQVGTVKIDGLTKDALIEDQRYAEAEGGEVKQVIDHGATNSNAVRVGIGSIRRGLPPNHCGGQTGTYPGTMAVKYDPGPRCCP
jgi:hypothetical protein